VARKWKLKHGIKVLYLDYLQRLADGDGDKRHEKVGANVRALKNLARELEIAVVALSQVSRAVEDRAVKIPRMSDLSDSSEIEKEADQVALLYRPDYYDPNSADAGKLQIVLDKNRHGPTGSVWVAWNAECMRVTDLYQGAA
jgi:replicative DNA helicase